LRGASLRSSHPTKTLAVALGCAVFVAIPLRAPKSALIAHASQGLGVDREIWHSRLSFARPLCGTLERSTPRLAHAHHPACHPLRSRGIVSSTRCGATGWGSAPAILSWPASRSSRSTSRHVAGPIMRTREDWRPGSAGRSHNRTGRRPRVVAECSPACPFAPRSTFALLDGSRFIRFGSGGHGHDPSHMAR
jgi:hypothetical protein